MLNGLEAMFVVALEFFHRFSGNYGLSIILLTVVARFLLWPLTQSQIVSSKKMQELQPQIEKIRQRFKGDQARLNQEMVKLWKENKVNPAAGCLPVLVQLPFLWGLYRALLEFTAFKGAPFLWITSLAAPDPYILPVLAGVTTFLQTWMITPRGQGVQQPGQQMFLWTMPILVVVITRTLPAGVALYWVISNLFSIGQQALILTRHGVPKRGSSSA